LSGSRFHREPKQYLSQLAEMMPHNPSTREVAQRILWLARQLAWCDSAVMFCEEQGKLFPTVIRSIHETDLLQDRPLGIPEPVVNYCWDNQVVATLADCPQTGLRIFTDEQVALALPIKNYGVLYLGRREREPFTEAEETHLAALTQQAYFAFAVARLSVSKESLQREEAESRKVAESLLHNVSNIVDIMEEIMGLTDPTEVLMTAGHNLFRVADFGFWTILADPDYFFISPENYPGLDRDKALELAKVGTKSGRTLSFMNLQRLSLPHPAEDIQSVLICPMIADGVTIGCLMLCSARMHFTLKERELVSTLALQVGSHFWNLHLHKELKQTHESLKLSQAQLVQSSKMAAVGQLAAGVAHELNTPLGAMNLAIEGAIRAMEKRPERTLSRLERALTAGNQLKEIIAKLLYYSKQSDQSGEETDLNILVKDTVDFIGKQLRLDNVEVHIEAGEIGYVFVNQNELQQVLINLLTNARDAMKENDPSERRIQVSTRTQGSLIELAVKDQGTGMPEDVVSKAFDPFFTTKEVGSGTGLGLSVSKELVEKYDGQIEVETAPNEGTTITLRFPEVQL